jgi:hypothetical protein
MAAMSDFARLTVARLRRDLAAAALGRGGGKTIRRTTTSRLPAAVVVDHDRPGDEAVHVPFEAAK